MQAALLAKKMAGKKKQAEQNASDKTKKMLGQIMDKFASFDTEMKIGTRVSSSHANGGRAAGRRLISCSLHPATTREGGGKNK